MAVLTYEDYDADSVEMAKKVVVEMTKDNSPTHTLDLFYSNSLDEIESGIRSLNDFSSKCWILSALALYTLIYDKQIYSQSGLDWQSYQKEAKTRLGLDPREVSEQLSGARFFISNRVKLINAGWNPSVPNQSLARAFLAVELSGDLDLTINKLVNSSVRDFKAWYQSFKMLPNVETEDKRPDIIISKSKIKINGVEAVKVNDKIPQQDKEQIEDCLRQIYTIIKSGNYPAIVSTYDEKEATLLNRLRDKHRQGK